LIGDYNVIVLESLQNIFTSDRVRDLNIKIDMDMSKKVVNVEEHFPVTLKPRTPGLSYDDSQMAPSITLSQTASETTWKGTGTIPEGPPGVEGQTPPAFKDMDNLYGEVTQKTSVNNEVVNKKVSQEERSPTIDRVTVSVNIDGTWTLKYDDNKKPVVLPNGLIEREYSPVSPEQLRSAQALVQGAIGYDPARGDSITVQNIPYDRSKEFAEADAAYFKRQQIEMTILIILGVIVLALICFMVIRAISKEMDRRRRLAEEERARREQAQRDQMLMQAEEGAEVPLSAEEQARMNLYENIANMAKDHPDGVAQLIRTWLLEE
jgi:flagellar M-ring protein FliF